MIAPLRWTLALAVVGALGFAAGRHWTRDDSVPTFQMTLPVAETASVSSARSNPSTIAPPRQVPSTVHEIMKLPSDFTQSAALHVLAAGTDRHGIERLLDEVDSIGRESERRSATVILYQRFAELDPEAAVNHVLDRPAGFDPNWLYAIYFVWARTDLDGAIAHAAQLDDQKRLAAGTAIVRSRDDLSRSEREAMVSQLDVAVAVTEPSATDLSSPKAVERAWRSALAIADRRARRAEQYKIVQAWARQDPQAAFQAIESLQNRSERDRLSQYAVQAWAQKQPRDAVAWVLERPPSYQRSQLLASALGSLVVKEPSTALAMVERLPQAEQRQVLSDVLMHWASEDAPAAAEWAMRLDNRRKNRFALNMVVSIFAQRDSEEAFRWAAALPGEQGQAVLGQVIQHIAQNDPERASAMVGHMDEGPPRAEAIGAVAQELATSDPRAALAWVARQSSSNVTPQVYARIFVQWAPYDTDGAVSQLNFMLEPDDRNAAIRGIVQGADLEPDLLDQLFQRVEGAEARRMTAEQVYYRLMEEDPARAEPYRIMAGLPPEQGGGD